MLPFRQSDWVLDETVAHDIDELMRWFRNADATRNWGGPDFRYPFNRHSFAEDMHWCRMASYSLRGRDGSLAGFGQLYERMNCINLARLAVNPVKRGQGIGKQLVGMLMVVGARTFEWDKYSLFVYRENKTAYNCYKAMGFVRTTYPENVKLADVCDYLTRPVLEQERKDAP